MRATKSQFAVCCCRSFTEAKAPALATRESVMLLLYQAQFTLQRHQVN